MVTGLRPTTVTIRLEPRVIAPGPVLSGLQAPKAKSPFHAWGTVERVSGVLASSTPPVIVSVPEPRAPALPTASVPAASVVPPP